jgi:hypothetical protein
MAIEAAFLRLFLAENRRAPGQDALAGHPDPGSPSVRAACGVTEASAYWPTLPSSREAAGEVTSETCALPPRVIGIGQRVMIDERTLMFDARTAG